MFTSENGMRSHTSKMMVLITDGKSPDSKFEKIGKEYQQNNIQLVIVGVGNVDKKSLKKLVANKEDLYIAKNFDELLKDVTTTFGSVICEAQPATTNEDPRCNADFGFVADVSKSVENHWEDEKTFI